MFSHFSHWPPPGKAAFCLNEVAGKMAPVLTVLGWHWQALDGSSSCRSNAEEVSGEVSQVQRHAVDSVHQHRRRLSAGGISSA
eukprot:symbB.v1.2.039543.t1/scaffold6636.1/size16569/2